MKKATLEKIEKDIRKNVRWLENGEEKKLSEVSILTIMTIIEVNYEEEQSIS